VTRSSSPALTAGAAADHTFEVVGSPELMVQRSTCAHGGHGDAHRDPHDMTASCRCRAAVMGHGKRIQGSVAAIQILRDFPRYIHLRAGQLDLGAMVSQTITLDQVNEGIDMLRPSRRASTVIV